MYYWYIPYHAHAAYPPPAVRSDLTALPSGTSPYPPVNTTQFHNSAKHSVELMRQAGLLFTKIAGSDTFASELMMSAQTSNQKKVDEMIASTGVTATFQTKFTPDGIRIHVQNNSEEGKCCELILILRW